MRPSADLTENAAGVLIGVVPTLEGSGAVQDCLVTVGRRPWALPNPDLLTDQVVGSALTLTS